ncbi:MAG: aminoacyl-tRNA hydrolase [Clostridia bacterium]|nr:aminoacyl-tRNA hydrolase [Clostridia bacterium]
MSNIFDLFKKIEQKHDTGPVEFIIAGLGNVGEKYASTRHNAGFIAIDYIASAIGVNIDRARYHALCTECRIADKRVLLMKPSTLMNNSGVAISEAASFYKIPPHRVLVLHDEISFDPGVIRIRRKGSAGGHNGLKSIISHLGSEEFPRIKIGVGKKPSPEYDLADFVLGRFSEAEMTALKSRLGDISTAAEMIVADNIDGAMAKFSK